MRKFSLILLLPLLFAGCGPAEKKESGKLTVVAGLPPVAAVAAAIAGDEIQVISLLPEGRTPHDFSPKASDIRTVHQSAFFISAGMPFEERLAVTLPDRVRVIDAGRGITRLPLNIDHHHHEQHDVHESNNEHEAADSANHHRHHHDAGTSDPHFWLSPLNAAAIAGNILPALTEADPANAEKYRANCRKFQAEMQALHQELTRQLEPCRGRTVLVYHPAFGYFTDAYGLHQTAIELDGREVTPNRLAEIIKKAREEKISAVFVQKQFKPATAAALASQLQAQVIETNPLPANLQAELRRFAAAIAAGADRQQK